MDRGMDEEPMIDLQLFGRHKLLSLYTVALLYFAIQDRSELLGLPVW